MKYLLALLVSISALLTANSSPHISVLRKTTAERIVEHGYPAEEYQVTTDDGYILTVFRIPYSPKLQNAAQVKPVAFLQHGLLSCSDCYVLNGPNDALAFLLSDAGYDVWLGNARGTTYSRAHIKLSVHHPYFWGFSWHEIGVYDVAAMIDFALVKSEQLALHYIGHSQGTTVFLVLMAVRPEYNAKIKTAHMLAPVAFAGNMGGALIRNAQPYFAEPGLWTALFGSAEFFPRNEFLQDIAYRVCGTNPRFPVYCSNIFFLWAGPDSVNINTTLLPFVGETHPAGISTDQLLHYVQLTASERFCMFDHGAKKNLRNYNQTTPPDYELDNITSNVYLYCGESDNTANPTDVNILAEKLPNLKENFLVDDPTWGHIDFVFANQVKKVIYDKVIQICDNYERDQVDQ